VIDTHLHLFNSRLGGTRGIPKLLSLDATIEGAVAAMRHGGVDKAFLITYNAQDIAEQFIGRDIDPASVRLVYNTQYQKTALIKHPDLFWWFPDHIDPLRETYLEDLQRNFEEGAAGIKLLPVFHGFLPDHPGFIPVYEMCRKYKKPVILDLSYWYLTHMPPRKEAPSRRNVVQRFSDYATLLAPLFREFATVPFSLAHAGTARQVSDYDEIFTLINDHDNVSCDIGAVGGFDEVSAQFVQFLAKGIGARKIMYGTDWPYWASGVNSYVEGSRRWTIIASECPDLSDEEKQWILADNAERFVKNQLPRPKKS
jgi:predicted TIM-barrel fold metal-dependent hydrolase